MFGKYVVYYLNLLIVILTIQQCKTNECIPKDYGRGSVVCVCNATYCDTVEPFSKPKKGQYIIYTSTKSGLRLKKTIGNFDDKLTPHTDEIIKVNIELEYQEILGWGGAFTDAAGFNIKSLNNGARNNLLRSYFSKDGIEYSLCRVPIGCSDLSLNYYSYDETPGDINLVHFNLTKEDYDYKIPFMKQAYAASNNSLRFFGSTWTAPVWMKSNNEPAGYGILKREYYQTWADYHIKFLDAYKKEGLNFWGLTTGNEPMLGITPFFDITSLGWYPWDQGRWIAENLGPAIRSNKDFKDVKIITHDEERVVLPWWYMAETFGNNASDYIDGIGLHWYTDPFFPSFLTLTHLLFPGKFLIGTEACTGDRRYKEKVVLGSWRRGEQYVEDIIEDVEHWVTGWVEWNLALNLQGGPSYIKNYVDASIIVNVTAQEFYKQPTFYTLGHFSKFVPIGSYKIFVEIEGKSTVKTAAFKRPDGGVAVILYNRHEKTKQVAITDDKTGYINIEVPERSVMTVLFWTNM